MPVNTVHASYDGAMKKVVRVRDFNEGEDAVKAKGETYLKKLGGQSKDAYGAYKSRSSLVPAVNPTAKAIAGSIMRKPPMFNPSAENLLSNVDGNDTDIETFTGKMIIELLLAGGAGYLVEYDENLRANTIKSYCRENIINEVPGSIVLRQFYQEVDPDDKFEVVTKTEYLELTFDEDGNYMQNIWREYKGKYRIEKNVYPTKSGEPIKFLPFVYSYAGSSYWGSSPLLLDLANVNWTQYRLSADLHHGLHWTALPTMFVFGDVRDEEGNKKQLKVGAGAVNTIDDAEARAELLEFSGAGLGAIDTAIKRSIDTMASIGAKMLTSEQGGVKAAETARIEASGETATLSGIANTVDMTMGSILEIIREWSGVDNGEFKVNRDFVDVKIDPQTLTALLKTWQAGGMSLNTFLYQLEKGELLPSNVSADDEAERIETTGRTFDL